jgi:hypothetical protein
VSTWGNPTVGYPPVFGWFRFAHLFSSFYFVLPNIVCACIAHSWLLHLFLSEWVSEWVSGVEWSGVELEQLPFKWWWGPLCTRPTHLVGFYSAGSLKQQSADWHVSAWKPYIFINILRTKAIPIHILFTYSYIRLKPKINAHRSIVYLIMLNYCIIIEAFVLAIKKLRWLKK